MQTELQLAMRQQRNLLAASACLWGILIISALLLFQGVFAWVIYTVILVSGTLLLVWFDKLYRATSRTFAENDLKLQQAEAARRRSDALTQFIIENNQDCIMLLSRSGNIEFINNRSLELLEINEKVQLIGRIWTDILPANERAPAEAAIRKAADGEKTNIRLSFPTFKGTSKWWDVSTGPLADVSGEGQILVLARDVTEQIMAEKALRESEAAFRKIFEENPMGMLMLDLQFRITRANNAISAMLGYIEKELIGRSIHHLSDSSDHALEAEGIERLVKGHGSTFQCEKQYRSKSGEIVWGHLTASLIHDSEGEPIYMILMIENINERKTSEKQVLAYQEQLQSLASELSLSEERERRQIATNLHDQIGQTLAFTRLKLGTLKKTVSETNGIASAVSEIQGLVEQAIADTRSLTFELSPPVLYELGLIPAIEWLARKFQKEHAISTHFNDDGLRKPLDDNFRIVLFQAVRELLVNVVKHAQASHVQVLIRRDADAIRIIIEDDGRGFNTATIHSHGDPTRGFGLFNVQERVEYLGGKVKFRSEEGHGTRVTLIAPLKLD